MKLETQFDMFIALKKDASCKLQVARSGFSLVELIMYLAIIGALTSVVIGMFVSFNRLRIKAESQTELAQNARSAVERLRQEIVKACSVASVSSSSSQATIKLNMPVSGSCGSTTITAFQIVSSATGNCTPANTLLMKESAASGDCADASWSAITGSKVAIAPLADTFTQITNTGAKSTIQIKLTFIYNNRPEYSYTTQTTAGLR